MDATEEIKPLNELEREQVERAMRICGGNRTHTARRLGISVRTLQRKLKAWGMQDQGPFGKAVTLTD